MKFYLIIISALLGLSSCEQTAQTFNQVKQLTGNLVSEAAPKAADIELRLPNVSPEELNLTAQTYPKNTQAVEQTIYFNERGQAVDAPDSHGFYREILGKTADGRITVQDFYQASRLPQTSVLTVKHGGDIRDFSTKILDGRNIWFDPDGQLHSVADFADGQLQGARAFYREKQLIGAIVAQKLLVFHDDGKILSIVETDADDSSIIKTTLFRADGSALLQVRAQGDTILNGAAWQPDGTPIREKADFDLIKQQSLPLSQKSDEMLRLMSE